MIVKCAKCSMNEQCICNHSTDECFIRKQSYNKAIDEFVEKLITYVESFQAELNGIRADLMTLDYFVEYVWETAGQMKGE